MTAWTWLGDHLTLDFVNTVRESEGVMVDLIPRWNTSHTQKPRPPRAGSWPTGRP